MARQFDDASTQGLRNLSASPIASGACTVACRCKSDDLTLRQRLFTVGDAAGNNAYLVELRGDQAGDYVKAIAYDGTFGTATTTSGYSANAWHHICAVFESSTSRKVYIDGGSVGSDSTSVSPAGMARCSIGININADTWMMSGAIADMAVWDTGLTADEAISLAGGVSPLLIRPQNLVAYWPLIRDEDQDRVGGYHMTPYNSPTIADHPPKIRPWWFLPSVVPFEVPAPPSSTGEKFPTASETAAETPWEDEDWDTPAGIYSDGGNVASVTGPQFDTGDQTYVLKGYTFDMSGIPAGATIEGVICRVNAWYANGAGSLDLMQLLDTSRAKVGTNQCATAVPLTTDTGTIITKGSSSDKWGNSLTDTWVKHSNFGVALGCIATGNNADVFIDYVTLEVYYSGGNLYVTPGFALGTASALNPGVVLGSTVATPAEALGVGGAVDPVVVLGSLSLTPAFALGTGEAIDPVVLLSDIFVTPAEALGIGQAMSPIVILNSMSVTPAEAPGTGSATDPLVVLGNIALTPAPASGTGEAVDPPVILGSIILTPAEAAALASAENPAVVLNSMVVIPAVALGVGSAQDPNVIVGGDVYVTPAAALAIASAIDPTVEGGEPGAGLLWRILNLPWTFGVGGRRL